MCGGFAEPIHNGDAEAVLRDGFDKNAIKLGGVESTELGEKRGGSLAEVAGGRKRFHHAKCV